MLIDHDAVLVESLEAASVKLLCKKSLTWAERIGRINYDNIILILTAANEFYAVLIEYVYSWVVKTAGCSRQIFLADLHNKLVNFNKVDILD